MAASATPLQPIERARAARRLASLTPTEILDLVARVPGPPWMTDEVRANAEILGCEEAGGIPVIRVVVARPDAGRGRPERRATMLIVAHGGLRAVVV